MKEATVKTATRVSAVNIIINIFLSALKFAAGFISGSTAMLSDAVDTVTDVIASVVVIFGVKTAGRRSDDDHQYGHDRLESAASILLAVIIGASGFGIGVSAVSRVFDIGEGGESAIPGVFALVSGVLSIIVKELMFRFTMKAAKKVNSSALAADAWHHRSDVLSSIGSTVGILLARLFKLPVIDPIAGVVISILIIRSAIEIFRDAMDGMVDKACPPELASEIERIAASHEGVVSVDLIKTRMFGSRIYVDIEISADRDKTLLETHAIAEEVHDMLEEKIPQIKHCMVHVNPA